MDTLTVDDLKARPERLLADAARGEAALIVDEGRPLLFALPVDETLLTYGARLALAVRLFEQEVIGLEGAARMAGLTQSEMVDHLGALKISLVRYSPGELEEEIQERDGPYPSSRRDGTLPPR
jgi:predicted HTH domain antitoxin